MRPRRFLLVCALGLFPLAGAYARPPATAAKDPQAVQILAQCLTAAGGAAAVATIQDFTGTGTITYYWAGPDTQGSVTVRGKGVNEFRLDANLPAGTRTWATSYAIGTLIATDGTRSAIPFYNLMTAGSLTLPAVRIASVLSDPSVAISYVGLVSSDVGQAFQVHIAPPVEPGTEALPGLGAFDLYIDPTTYQLLELAESNWALDTVGRSYAHEIVFSNYTPANGVAVPYSVTEKFAGQRTWSIALTSITFNGGLTDDIFIFHRPRL